MRAVVTGGAGFLGSHLTDRLIAEGWEVVVFDNLLTGSTDNLAQHLGNPAFRFVKQDVTEYLFVDGPVDFVFHFASAASPRDFKRFPIPVLKAGALGTHKTLGLAKEKGAKFMLASTSEVYGDPLVSPQPESYWGNVNPIGPRGVYDEAKRYAEAMTMAYHSFHRVDTRIVRFFNTYGPRMRLDDGRVVPNFIGQALRGEPLTIYGAGEQTRSFGYFEDVIDGVWRLAHSDYHDPVNIGNDEERTILSFALGVLVACGMNRLAAEAAVAAKDPRFLRFLEAETDDPQRRRPDLTRAKSVLGWQPTTSLEQGLKPTVEYFRNRLARS